MKLSHSLIALAHLSQVVRSSPTSPRRPPNWQGGQGAIYFLRVDPAGNSIVAIEVGRDGLLTQETSVTSTDGVGLQQVNYATKQPTPIDPLQGQDAVTVGGGKLFTINSGSDTAVMFSVDESDPLQLEMVGQPVPTLGQFPMAVAFSGKYNKMCCLNGGKVNGVACYSVTNSGLVADGVGLRNLRFPSTTPPQLSGPSGAGSDVQFTPDSSKLIVTFKGAGTGLGHIVIFDVNSDGAVASTWTDNQVQPLEKPFGFAQSLKDLGSFFITDVTFGGGALVDLDPSTNKVSVRAIVNETEYVAACWSVWSPETNSFYAVNTLTPKIGEINAEGTVTQTFTFSNATLGGGTDTAVIGSNLYFLSDTNEVVVMNSQNGQILQQYPYSVPSNRPYWTGMAFSGSGSSWNHWAK